MNVLSRLYRHTYMSEAEKEAERKRKKEPRKVSIW